MSADSANTQPTDAGSGNPPDLSAETPSVRAVKEAVRELETHRGYMTRDLDQARGDMRDVRDRLRAIEVKVEALPSKAWTGSVVVGAFALMSGLVTLLKLFGR